MRTHWQTGFTLLELLVVLVTIGLLVGAVAPRYFLQACKFRVKVVGGMVARFLIGYITPRFATVTPEAVMFTYESLNQQKP